MTKYNSSQIVLSKTTTILLITIMTATIAKTLANIVDADNAMTMGEETSIMEGMSIGESITLFREGATVDISIEVILQDSMGINSSIETIVTVVRREVTGESSSIDSLRASSW
jgi:hypothetical protein